jgi:lysophospholipase L1-like esterase
MIIGDSLSLFPGGYQTQLSNNITNLSKVGYPTSKMLKILDKNKSKIRKHDLVIIYGGINDIYGGVNESVVVGNIQKMVNIVNENGGYPVLILGYNPLKVHRNKNKSIKYYKLQTSLKTKIHGVRRIVPIFDDINNSHMSKDGIHLNVKGNRAFTEHLLNHI